MIYRIYQPITTKGSEPMLACLEVDSRCCHDVANPYRTLPDDWPYDEVANWLLMCRRRAQELCISDRISQRVVTITMVVIVSAIVADSKFVHYTQLLMRIADRICYSRRSIIRCSQVG